MMAIATALAITGAAIAAGGAIKSSIDGAKAADAQGKIAQEQLDSAKSAQQLAAPTAQEVQTLNNQITLYGNAYANSQSQLSTLQKQITDTYGANIIQEGQALHNELAGQNSVVTQQAQAQLDRQRQQYQQQLTDKLGPGALNSSAGIQAMATFDRNASQSIAQIQESSINNEIQRLGTLQGGQSAAVNSVNGINQSLSGMLGQIQGTQNALQTRQINAANNVTQYQGADQVQSLQSAKNGVALGNNITNIGANLLGAGLAGNKTANPSSPSHTEAGIGNVAQGSTNGLSYGNFGSSAPLGGNFNYQSAISAEGSPSLSWDGSSAAQSPSLGGNFSYKPPGSPS